MAVSGVALQRRVALPQRGAGALRPYDAAVAFGLALSGFVAFQPAPTDAVLGLVLVAALASGRLDLARVPAWVVVLVGAFLALNAVSLAPAVSERGAFEFLAITVFVLAVAVWFAGYVDRPARARLVVLAYGGAALLAAVLGIAALIGPLPGRETLLYHGCCRAQALFKDPNVFGPFLIPAVVVALEELLTPRLLPWRRSTKILILLVLSLGVLVSYSRAAWLNAAVAILVVLLVLLLRRGAGRNVAALLAVVAVVGGSVGVYVAATGSEGFLRERAGTQTYDTSRFAAQSGGIALAERHPLGVGPGQFDEHEPISAHSLYVRVLAEQGALGFAVMVLLLGGTLALAVANVVAGRSTYGIGSAALLAVWCGLLANSFFVDTLHWRHLWLVAALIWAGGMRGYRSRTAYT
jgi:O-antigen ligase